MQTKMRRSKRFIEAPCLHEFLNFRCSIRDNKIFDFRIKQRNVMLLIPPCYGSVTTNDAVEILCDITGWKLVQTYGAGTKIRTEVPSFCCKLPIAIRGTCGRAYADVTEITKIVKCASCGRRLRSLWEWDEWYGVQSGNQPIELNTACSKRCYYNCLHSIALGQETQYVCKQRRKELKWIRDCQRLVTRTKKALRSRNPHDALLLLRKELQQQMSSLNLCQD